MSNDDRVVYSSGPGTTQDKRKDSDASGKRTRGGGRSRGGSAAPAKAAAAKGDPVDGVARVRRETKGRGGKTVTAIAGLALGDADLRELAKELRRMCGSGGSCKAGVIEIQGDHADRMVEELVARGHRAKRAGG